MLHVVPWNLWKRVSVMRAKHKRVEEDNFSAPYEPSLVSDEPVVNCTTYITGGTVRPKRVITLNESDYAQLQSLVLKYGSGTGHGTSLSIDARVAVADATYDWSKDEDTSRKAD